MIITGVTFRYKCVWRVGAAPLSPAAGPVYNGGAVPCRQCSSARLIMRVSPSLALLLLLGEYQATTLHTVYNLQIENNILSFDQQANNLCVFNKVKRLTDRRMYSTWTPFLPKQTCSEVHISSA